MEDTRTIKGLSDLQRFLDTLAPKIEKNIMSGALRAGSKPILANARSRIHSISGETAASLRISVSTKNGRVTARIIAGGSKANIMNRPIWLEYGTRAHLIKVEDSQKPINPKESRRAGHVVRVSMSTINRIALQIKGRFVGPVVKHPGARRHPFLRPALDTMASTALIAVREYIKMRLTKEGIDASGVGK